jgi:Uma2 family endonuclease
MGVKTEATVDDLARVTGKAELVDGRLVRMSPSGGYHSVAAGEIFASLREYARKTRRGHAIPDNAGFVVELPHRKSFSPDAAYHLGEPTRSFFRGAPVFAVEVRSDSDYGPAGEKRMNAKRADYFAAGTLVVWDVDLHGEDVIRSFRTDAPEAPTVFRRGEIASAEPAVPGWTMEVDELWP